MRGSRFGKGIAMVLVAAVGALSAGCFGKFQLTRKLYDINQSIDEKYVRSAATWLFVIPYAVTGLLDFVVFNLIEFWTGENPVAEAKVTKVYAQGNGRTVLTLSRDGSAWSATTGGEKSPRSRRRRARRSARFPRSRRPTGRWK
jgi:hypothetical protein